MALCEAERMQHHKPAIVQDRGCLLPFVRRQPLLCTQHHVVLLKV